MKIAGIKAGNAAGFFFPEAVVCAFMWAGDHHINVTNNSYFADPWLFNCKNDPGQRAIWTAERRAIKYAQQQGDVVVAAESNQADDLSHPTQDATSPDDTTPVLRQIHNDCAVVPVEVPGVIGVTADGNKGFKSFYSSYGVNTASVMAPGGDSILQLTPASPNGRVLSTWPASLLAATCLPARRVVDASGATYCYQQGTSMASPHAAGVAALIMSQYPTLSSNAVAAKLQNTADPVPCPSDLSIYAFFPAVDNGAPQVCQGGAGHNSFAGSGPDQRAERGRRVTAAGARGTRSPPGAPLYESTISAAGPTMRARRGTVSSTLSRAQNSTSASSPGGPYVRAFSPSSAVGNDCATSAAATAASLRSPPTSCTIRPAQYASSSAKPPL